MTYDPTTPRPDLIDRGYVVPTKAPAPARSRKPPTLLTEGDLDAPRPADDAIGFDARGDFARGDAPIVAKRMADGRAARFFVRVSTHGPDRGHFFDPYGIYSRATDLALEDRRGGKSKFEFVAVPEAAFLDYLHYLRHRDGTFLRRAERLVLNG